MTETVGIDSSTATTLVTDTAIKKNGLKRYQVNQTAMVGKSDAFDLENPSIRDAHRQWLSGRAATYRGGSKKRLL